MTINEIYAAVLALFAALTAGLVGSFALMKRMTLAGDAISHIALPGLGLGILFKVNPTLGGAVTLILGTILIWQLEKRTGIATETMIGVVFSTSLALGALITPKEDLIDVIFGGFAPLSTSSFLLGLLIALFIIWFIAKFKDKLIINLFSSDLGISTGINADRLNLYYLLIFSLTIILGLQFLGASLAGSLIIIPAAAARRFTEKFTPFLLTSALVSLAAVVAGLFVSRTYGLSLGPTVISAASFIFALSLFKRNA